VDDRNRSVPIRRISGSYRGGCARRKPARLALRKRTFAQRSTDRPKPQYFELQKSIAVIKSLAIPFRNHAHRLRTRFDERTRHDSTVLRFEATGCERIFREKATGGRWNRPELQRLLDHLRKGDVLVVWKLDRLSRSLRDVLTIMERIQEAKAGFRSLTAGGSPSVSYLVSPPRIRIVSRESQRRRSGYTLRVPS